MSPIGAAYIDSLFELKPPGRGDLGEEELVTLVSETINAGTDTSATTVEWALLHLVTNQDMQEKLYKEIVACVGKNGIVGKLRFYPFRKISIWAVYLDLVHKLTFFLL